MTAYQTMTDPTAVQGRRIGAWVIDIVIIVALGFILSQAFPAGESVFGNVCEQRGVSDSFFDTDDLDASQRDASTSDAEMCLDGSDLIIYSEGESVVFNLSNTFVPNLVVFLYIVGVFWIWQGLSGMTPGKAIVGIRTVNAAGERPGVLKAFLRWLLWIVDAFPYCCLAPVVGGITMLASKRHRRVGDMVAGTYVVAKEFMGAGPIDGPVAGAMTSTPGTFGSTAPPEAGPFGSTAPPMSSGDAQAPQWDPQRNAYIQWDEARGVWLEFDDSAQTWKPIST